MRNLALIAVLLVATPTWAQTVLDPTTVYVADPLKWERGQRPDQMAPKLAFATILIIEPNGALAIVSCHLYKSPDNKLDILYQSGFSLSSGTWKKADRQLAVRFRSIHSSARKLDGTDQHYKEELWSYVPSRKGERIAERINVGGAQYIPLRNLSDLKALAEVIQFYRTQK
jgi:hypothetical protein